MVYRKSRVEERNVFKKVGAARICFEDCMIHCVRGCGVSVVPFESWWVKDAGPSSGARTLIVIGAFTGRLRLAVNELTQHLYSLCSQSLSLSVMSIQRMLRVPSVNLKNDILRQAAEEPLRILFCGSDSFSIASLRKLYSHYQSHKKFIASIDVVCRPGKRVGRGLKTIREGVLPCHLRCRDSHSAKVPISEAAKQLRLPLHEIDTFTNWKVRFE